MKNNTTNIIPDNTSVCEEKVNVEHARARTDRAKLYEDGKQIAIFSNRISKQDEEEIDKDAPVTVISYFSKPSSIKKIGNLRIGNLRIAYVNGKRLIQPLCQSTFAKSLPTQTFESLEDFINNYAIPVSKEESHEINGGMTFVLKTVATFKLKSGKKYTTKMYNTDFESVPYNIEQRSTSPSPTSSPFPIDLPEFPTGLPALPESPQTQGSSLITGLGFGGAGSLSAIAFAIWIRKNGGFLGFYKKGVRAWDGLWKKTIGKLRSKGGKQESKKKKGPKIKVADKPKKSKSKSNQQQKPNPQRHLATESLSRIK